MSLRVSSNNCNPLIERHEQTVATAYRNYVSTRRVNEEELNHAALALEQLERIELARRAALPTPFSEPPSAEIVLTRWRVKEMHMASKQLSLCDLLQMKSFFQKNPEQYYTDKKGIRYYQPDDSHLLELAGKYFSLKDRDYEGFGLSKDHVLRHPTTQEEQACSLLYFTKRADQIAPSERSSMSSVWHFFWNGCGSSNPNAMQERRNRQSVILSKLKWELEKKAVAWNYDCFRILEDFDAFDAVGMTLENFKKIHAVALFYKKCEEGDSRGNCVDHKSSESTEPRASPEETNATDGVEWIVPADRISAEKWNGMPEPEASWYGDFLSRVGFIIGWFFAFIKHIVQSGISRLKFCLPCSFTRHAL